MQSSIESLSSIAVIYSHLTSMKGDDTLLTSLSSNAITTKARAIYGKRLTNKNYSEMLRLATVPDVCAYLRSNTDYARYLKGVNEAAIHRGQLESIISRSRISKYFSLLNYDFSKSKGFYSYVLTKIETDIILNAVILINSDSNEDIIANIPAFLQEHLTFDLEAISKAKDFKSLLEVLVNTKYYNVIKKYEAENGEIRFADCEFALKVFYYDWLFKQINTHYKGKIREELLNIVKIEIELLNIGLIYRLKTHFKRSPEQVKLHLLPYYYRLNKNFLNELINTKTADEFITRLKQSSYGYQLSSVEFNYIEDYTKRLKYILTRKMMRATTKAPITFYALMTLLQIEVDNIIVIIEGIRYKDEESEIQKLLILE